MRLFLLAVLLAGAASPVFAAPRERPDDRERSERPARAERPAPRPQRSERRQSEERRPAQVERTERSPAAPARSEQRPILKRVGDGGSDLRRSNPPQRSERATERPDVSDSVRNWRESERVRDDRPASIEERNLRRAPRARPGRDLVEQERPLPPVLDRTSPRRISKTPKPGTEPPAPATVASRDAEPRHRWRHDWRRDHRYDWRDHRRRHKNKFRLAIYFDPFGWNYYRYGIGWRLWPSYYSSRFWLHDPRSYHLPPAYGPYRWIRYWDDALLVNIYTGQVVDVIHDFFW